jgi:hypothetical protein
MHFIITIKMMIMTKSQKLLFLSTFYVPDVGLFLHPWSYFISQLPCGVHSSLSYQGGDRSTELFLMRPRTQRQQAA